MTRTAPGRTSDQAPSPTRGPLATEARLFGRDAGAMFWILVFPTALLCVLGAVPAFREPSPDMGGQRVVDLYLPVVVLLAAIISGVQSMPAVLSGYREAGVLRRLQATPVGPMALLRAQVALHGLAILAGSAISMVVGRVVFDISWPGRPLGWAAAYVLAVAASLAVGAVITAVASSTKVATTLGTVVFFPLMFTAGVWLPVQTMPGLLQDIVLVTPLGASARALGDAAVGDWPRLVDLAVTGGWAAVLAVVAIRCFRWE